MKIRNLALALILVLGGMFLYPQISRAIGVSPTIFDELNVDPGETLQFEFNVLNDYYEEKRIYFYTQNFTSDGGETGGQTFIEEELDWTADLASWITVVQDSVLLPVRGKAEANVVIQIPEGAEPGGHYAVIWASDSPPDEGGTVSLAGNVGVLVLINVNGDVNQGAVVKEFNYLKKFQNRLPVDFITRIGNEGNVYFKPKGDIVIKGLFGNEVARINANPKSSNILPNSIRRLEGARWIKTPDIIEGGFVAQLKNEWHNFGFGPYKAHLDMTFASGGEIKAKTKYFWIMPWRIIILSLLILLILYAVLKLYKRSIIKSAQKGGTESKKEDKKNISSKK